MLTDAIKSFLEGDTVLAKEVLERDNDVDWLNWLIIKTYNQLHQDITVGLRARQGLELSNTGQSFLRRMVFPCGKYDYFHAGIVADFLGYFRRGIAVGHEHPLPVNPGLLFQRNPGFHEMLVAMGGGENGNQHDAALCTEKRADRLMRTAL